jgi:hypothetical protein
MREEGQKIIAWNSQNAEIARKRHADSILWRWRWLWSGRDSRLPNITYVIIFISEQNMMIVWNRMRCSQRIRYRGRTEVSTLNLEVTSWIKQALLPAKGRQTPITNNFITVISSRKKITLGTHNLPTISELLSWFGIEIAWWKRSNIDCIHIVLRTFDSTVEM